MLKACKGKLITIDNNRVNAILQFYQYANHSLIEQYISEFAELTRDQRLPLSKTLIQERDRMIARNPGLKSFKALNGLF